MTQIVVGDLNSTERGSGARANGGKAAFSLVPLHLLAGTARVLMGGRLKYKAHNWTKGMAWSNSFDSLMRHLNKWWYLGEDIDAESGEHHLDHAMCNLLFLRHYLNAYPEGDDRPPQELTHFHTAIEDFNAKFDEAAFLARRAQHG
jgi:hypothetical protein